MRRCTGTSRGRGVRVGGSMMRESASSKRASGDGSCAVKSIMSLGLGMVISHMN